MVHFSASAVLRGLEEKISPVTTVVPNGKNSDHENLYFQAFGMKKLIATEIFTTTIYGRGKRYQAINVS
ncbi:MAG: hypothetical protein ACE5KD_04525 [Candidatus Bathyarchaeia archaeon]